MSSIDDDLGDFPPVPPPAALDARVRRAAQAELDMAAGPRWRATALRVWTQVALPAAITVTVVGYLSWAVQTASGLYR
jgi:hypothetical protein